MTTDEQLQYRAVLGGMGLLDYTSRGKLLATGCDRVGFLHAMVTNDVEGLDEFCGCYAAFLTPRGKMIADFYLYRFPDSIILDVEMSLLPRFRESLQRFIIMDDVFLEDISHQWDHLSVQGPESETVVSDVFSSNVPTEQFGVVEVPGLPVRLVRRGDLSSVGFDILVPPREKSAVKARLLDHRTAVAVAEVGEHVRNVLRLERAIPVFGQDMDGSNYPMEARLGKAISFSKGCYVGQEVVAKATHVGGVGRLLMCLEIEGNTPPAQGAELKDHSGQGVGCVTSAVFSPRLGHAIALGYVRKRYAVPGQECSVALPGGDEVSARIVEYFA